MAKLNKNKVKKFQGGFFGKKKSKEDKGKEDSTLKILDYLQNEIPEDEEEDEIYVQR